MSVYGRQCYDDYFRTKCTERYGRWDKVTQEGGEVLKREVFFGEV